MNAYCLLLIACLITTAYGKTPGLNKSANLLSFVKRPGVVETAKLTKFLQSDAMTSAAAKINFGALDANGWSIFHHLAVSADKAIPYGEVGTTKIWNMAQQALSKEEFAALLNTQVTADADHPLVEVGDTVAHIVPRLNGDYSNVGDEWLNEGRHYINPNIQNSKGMTPFFEVIAHGSIKQLKTLRFGYETVDETLMSSLHVAVANQQYDMIRELLRVYDNSGEKKKALAELNEKGETVAEHMGRLIKQTRQTIRTYEREIKPWTGKNINLIKELFLQGKSSIASPQEYYQLVERVELLENLRSTIQED